MTIQALPELGSNQGQKTIALRCHIQNISEGGVCLITSRPIEESSVLRCEIIIGDVLRISTLMQVRWTRKQEMEPEAYISGLDFLL